MKVSILQIKSEGEGIVAVVTIYKPDFKMPVIINDILNYGLDALLENEGPHDLTVTDD